MTLLKLKAKLIVTASVLGILAGCQQGDGENGQDDEDDAGQTAQSEMMETSREAGAPETAAADDREAMADNPFLAGEWDTPYGVPPFGEIDATDFPAAMDAAMEAHLAEIEAIANQDAEPTFENTIVALDESGEQLSRTARVFYNLVSAHTNPQLQEVRAEYAPLLSEHSDSIVLNADLWERVRAVYEKRDELDLATDQAKLLEDTHRDFVRAGAALNDEDKERLTALNAELATLYSEFAERTRAEQTRPSVIVTDKARLDGLPEDQIQAARAFAERAAVDEGLELSEEQRAALKDGYAFNMIRSSFTPVLQFAHDRALRAQVLDVYYNRGANGGDLDTRDILKNIAVLRAEKAQLLGYETFAEYAIEPRMAGTPEAATQLMTRVLNGAVEKAKEERADLEAMLQEELGPDADLQPHDWWYYTEKVRKARFNLSEEELKPYFQVNAVRDGAFYVASRIFDIEFTEVTQDVPRYHEDVQAFEVTSTEDGSHVGLLYIDYTARPSKRGGAWAAAYRAQSDVPGKEEVRPVIVNVGNFFSPTSPDDPGLMSWDSVLTLFHELGHAIHGLVSDVRYEGQAGTSVKRDYVEFPSQLLENWASEPEVLKRYATHYQTGETIPTDMIERIKEADTFNNGFRMTELAAASLLDLAWHTKTPDEVRQINDVQAFDTRVMEDLGVIPEIAPRYHSPYFQHIFAGDGYSAGYYVYLWSQVLAADAWQAFEEAGDIFDPDLSDKLAEEIFAVGGSRDEMESYVTFRGQEPDPDALLKEAGLSG